MKIEFVLWDKELQGKQNAAERQDILLYVERAVNAAWHDEHAGEGVKVIERGWCNVTFSIEDLGNSYYRDSMSLFVSRLMSRLHRLHRLYAANDLFEVNYYEDRA